MNILGYGKKYTFATMLNPEECIKTLIELVNSGDSTADFQFGIIGSDFRISMKTDLSNSSYNPVFYGKIVGSGRATTIEGYFGVTPFSLAMTIFLYAWMLVLPVLVMKSGPILSIMGVLSIVLLGVSIITAINLIWGRTKMQPILEFLRRNLQVKNLPNTK
jgi:hypothetical protein